MPRDKKILYTVSAILPLILSAILFLPTSSSRYIAATLLLAFVGICSLLIKKRTAVSYNKKQVLGLVAVFGAIYLVLIYLSGIYFGFSQTFRSFGNSLLTRILPTTVIIVSIEIIRSIMLAQRKRAATILCYISSVLADVLIAHSIGGIHDFTSFMSLVGLTFLPAISANALYHYLSEKYGRLPNIVYRLIITLYAYILPVAPSIPDVLSSLAKLLFPMLIYFFISTLYERKRRFAKTQKKSRVAYVSVAVTMFLMVSFVMLISCKFKYGALVIATESMTGEINKGDVAIYEAYDGQEIEIGQVIVFNRYDSKIVHRVVKKENVNGIVRYYTKGDIHEKNDEGYVLEQDIVGIAQIKLPYMGYPTLWLRKLFK